VRRIVAALAALILLGAGCAGPFRSAAPTAGLPAPQVQHRALPTPTLPPAAPTALPSPTAPPAGLAELARAAYGERLIATVSIPSLFIYAPVVPVGWQPDPRDAQASAWDSPEAAVGWAISSALPGDNANIILYGHNNIDSSVFKNLSQLQTGDVVELTTGERTWRYRVTGLTILPVQDAEADAAAFAEVFAPGEAPRLTLLSCWPPDNNTHRVVVTAELDE